MCYKIVQQKINKKDKQCDPRISRIKAISKIFELEVLLSYYLKRKLCRRDIVPQEAEAIIDFEFPLPP